MKFLITSLILLLVSFFAGCKADTNNHDRKDLVKETRTSEGWREQLNAEQNNFNKAVAVLQPAEGKEVSGMITFTKDDNGIKVVADIKGLTPGMHGFHIHEFGDCSAADYSSAGNHFNPLQHQHGAPTDMERHTGDLGNIEADDSGNAHLEWTDSLMTFYGANSILGRAVVVHEKQDDLTSQPSGDAGGRVACGVIGIAKQ